jgi:hypothetical protein
VKMLSPCECFSKLTAFSTGFLYPSMCVCVCIQTCPREIDSLIVASVRVASSNTNRSAPPQTASVMHAAGYTSYGQNGAVQFFSDLNRAPGLGFFGNDLSKTSVFRVNLNIDGPPVSSRSHTHPSHFQTSLLLTSFLSLGVPVSQYTQDLNYWKPTGLYMCTPGHAHQLTSSG